MPRIHTLSPEHARRIAAGQVVDRPASIVKELLENAIDAHATTITLRIEDGGKTVIALEDNGCGMDAQDAQKCFEKHATSKLATFDELSTLTTFGFRGEALASIAAVSHVTLITREHTASEGIYVKVEDGIITHTQLHAAPPGTSIEISNLFHAIPARKKFLKKKETEWHHIVQLFHAFCLDELSIHFILHADGKLVHNCPPVPSLIDRFAQLKEKNSAHHMMCIDAQRSSPSIKVHGIISEYGTYRYDRDAMFIFVNKRWVQNFALAKAVLRGYKNTLPQGKFPLTALHITIDPLYVDINIHPRKEEVQFLHPYQVQELISLAVTSTLEGKLSDHLKASAPTHVPQQTIVQSPAQTMPFTPFNFTSWFSQPTASSGSHPAPAAPQAFPLPLNKQPASETIPVQTPLDPKIYENEWNIIGQLFATYIMIQQEQGLLLVDQHAAHERILYEEFEKRWSSIPTIALMFPHTFELSKADMDILEPHLTLINQHGIGIEIIGEQTVSICACPVHLKNVSLGSLIRELITKIKEYADISSQEVRTKLNHDLRAQMACKAAVKAGDLLSLEHMKQIVNDLQKTDNRFACPHGRPTSWLIPIGDIEKKFRRDYRP